MDIRYEVTAKTETRRMDGTPSFFFQGQLLPNFGAEAPERGEPLNLAVMVTENLFGMTDIGDVIVFPYSSEASEEADPYSVTGAMEGTGNVRVMR